MTRLLHIAVKDMKILLRDKAAFLIMLGMPLVLIFILGSALSGVGESENVDIPVAIVSVDAGDQGAPFAEAIADVEELQAVFNIEVLDDVELVRSKVEKGDLTAVLVIPVGFTEALAAGEPIELEVLQDPGSEMTAGIWVGVARAAAANLSAGQIVRITVENTLARAGIPQSPVTFQQGDTGGDIAFDAVSVKQLDVEPEKQVEMIDYYAAGQTGLFLLFGAMFGAFGFARERRERTFARILASPATTMDLVGGKSLGILGVACAQFLVLYLGTTLLFGVDWGPTPSGILLVGFAEAWAATGLAMTLSVLGKTERAIGGIGPTVIMLFAALGGSMIPVDMMPAWMLPLQSVSPVYWAMGAFLDLMRGEAFSVVLMPVGILLGIGAVLFTFGLWRLRYE
ncbi:MAG: ABC transporter permease [Coriobacteriia bacterium]|nr:ABC transporter permease [Coriobacteriia bacterium]